MVNYREIVQHPAVKESDYSPDFALPIQSEIEPPIVGAKKIGLPLLAEFIGRLLEFLPNKTRNKTGSVGVLDNAMVAVTGSASLDMSGDANIKFGLGVNLHSKGAGAISGLQGTIKDASSLSVYCRVYKINGDFEAEATNADIYNSFSAGDVFYFVAAPELQESATLSYRNASGIEKEALIDKENSMVLILVEKRNAELRFQKISDTSLIERIHKALLEHINDPEIHIDQSEREYWNAKADQSALDKEVSAREEEYESLREYIDFFSKGKRNQLRLGDGELTSEETEDGEPFNAASSLFAEPDVRNDALDAVYGEFMNQGSRISIELFSDLIFNGVRERLLANGDLTGSGSPANFISTVTITITPPVNGMPMSNEVVQPESEDTYTAGTVVWEPDDDTANGTQNYIGYFTLTAAFLYQFHPATSIRINGGAVSFAREMLNNFVTKITLNFPATMTANPAPNISIPVAMPDAVKPTTATINDAGSYSVAIAWDSPNLNYPPVNTAPEGTSTATFTLTADGGYRWNDNVVTLNGVTYEGELNPEGTILTFEKTFITSMVDSRDGKSYRVVQIGNQTWMAENLNWTGAGAWFNNGSAEPFAKAGRLYTWDEALTVAPPGWHLPSTAEWDTLVDFIGGASGGGAKLKATSGWNNYGGVSGNGTDDYGFAGLPGGQGGVDNIFIYLNEIGYWWSATAGTPNHLYATSYLYQVNYNNNEVYKSANGTFFKFSVRCVKD